VGSKEPSEILEVGMTKREKRQERRVASARTRAENREQAFERTAIKVPSGMQVFTLPKKGCRVAIIPYEVSVKTNKYAKPGDLYYEKTYFVHRGVGPEEQAFVCPRRNFDQKCPICEHRAKLNRDPKADKESVKALEPKQRQIFNIIDLSDLEKGVQLFDISYHLFGKKLDDKVENGDDGEYDQFFHPDEGFSLKLGVNEKSFNGRSFNEVGDIDFKPYKEPIAEELLASAADLDKLLIPVEYEKLKKLFLQTDDEDDEDDEDEEEDDDDDDSPPPKKKGKVKDEEDDDEEEEKEAPKKKSSKKPAKKADPDDDDDDSSESDDDDEDDDPPPKKKLPTAKSAGIKLGSKVKHKEHGVCEVVHISPDGTSLRLKDEDDDVQKAIGVAEVKLIEKSKAKPKDDDDDEDEPPKKSSKKSRKDSFDDDDDDDDDEEEDDEDDEDEEVKPKKGKKKPKDDDEDDDD
jgi:hypothetical protein